jgi:hypothetical protein
VIRPKALQFEHPSNVACLGVPTTGAKVYYGDGPIGVSSVVEWRIGQHDRRLDLAIRDGPVSLE